MKINVYYIFLLFCLLTAGLSCKQGQNSAQDPDPITADSSSISSLVISCKSATSTIAGLAVIDVQQYFLSGKVVSSATKGRMFAINATNENNFIAVVDKITLDFQTPESYFKNYDSFIALFDEQVKTKPGFQMSYDLSQQQIEQLIDKQDVILADNGVQQKMVFYASVFPLTLSLFAAPLSQSFSLNRFRSTMNIGSRIIGTSRNYARLGYFFIDPTVTTRNTAQTQSNQIVVSSYSSTGYYGGYSYNYPLPPSPAPIFDAPAWYWHRYTDPPTGQTFSVIPPNITTSGFSITNFNSPAVTLDNRINATVNAGVANLVYSASNGSSAEIGPKSKLFELRNGWETTFTFSGQTGQRIFIETANSNGSYRYFGIFTDKTGTTGIALTSLQAVTSRQNTVSSVFDGKTHKLKVSLVNKANNGGSRVEIYLDQILIYVAEDSNSLGFIHPELAQISVGAFNNPVGDGNYKVHDWVFKTF